MDRIGCADDWFCVSGRLVKAILKVNAKLIRTMDINTKYIIDGVEVTAIDANQ